jgi:hypothetical protein
MGSSGRDDWNRHWKDYGQGAGQNPAQNYRVQLTLSARHPRPGEGDAGFTHEYVFGVGFPFFNLYRCLVICAARDSSTISGQQARLPWQLDWRWQVSG